MLIMRLNPDLLLGEITTKYGGTSYSSAKVSLAYDCIFIAQEWFDNPTGYPILDKTSSKHLKKSLKRAGADINSIPFPNKTLLPRRGTKDKTVKKRRPMLEKFLKEVVGMYNGNESTESASGIIYEFLIKGATVQASSPPPKSEPEPAQVAKPAQPPVEARVTDEPATAPKTAAKENRYVDL